MKVEAQYLDDNQVRLTVEIEPEKLEESKRRSARRIAKHTKIPGFRPGKAPYNVILRTVGEGAILEEAIDLLVDDIYPKVIDEANIEPYGPGSLEDIKSTDPLTLDFLVPLRATVTLGDYPEIRHDYQPKEITDEEVDNVLQNLREQGAIIEPVERAAQVGDLVILDITGTKVAPGEGENPTLIPQRSVSILIEPPDADTEEEWPFPGFSQHLIGTTAGEEKKLAYQFPEDYSYESLRGLPVDYDIKVTGIRSRSLPDLDDELAQSYGDYETIAQFRDVIRESLIEQSLDEYHQEYDEAVLDKIIAISEIKYPPQMLEREVEHVIEHLKNNLAERGLDIDLYLKSRQIDMDGLREETRPVAETRLKRSLVILEIADAEKIQVEPQELETQTEKMMETASQVLPKKDFRKFTTRENTMNVVGNIMMDMIIERTQSRLRDIARGAVVEETQASESDEVPVAEAESAHETDVESTTDGDQDSQQSIE